MTVQVRSRSHRRRIYPKPTYADRVLSYSPIAYWPLWEAAGAVAEDISGHGFDGAYVGVTLGSPGIGDGEVCPFFDGANDWVNVFSAALATAFDSTEGSMIIWCKMFNVGVWTDGNQRMAFQFRQDVNNRLVSFKLVNNTYRLQHDGAGVGRFGVKATTTISWFHWAVTWSIADNETLFYFDGAEFAADAAPTVWAGAMGTAYVSDNGFPFHGWLAHAAVFNRPLSAKQIYHLGS